MEYLEHAGRTYEISVLALADADGYRVELADVSLAGRVLAEALVAAETVSLLRQEPMPTVVFSWWAAWIAEVAGLTQQ